MTDYSKLTDTPKGGKMTKRHTGYYGKRIVICQTCGNYRNYGEECPVCDGLFSEPAPGISDSIPRGIVYVRNRLISESDVERAENNG